VSDGKETKKKKNMKQDSAVRNCTLRGKPSGRRLSLIFALVKPRNKWGGYKKSGEENNSANTAKIFYYIKKKKKKKKKRLLNPAPI